MKLQEIERKLAALALDAACQNGELENSAVKFFTLLKKRGIASVKAYLERTK